MYVKSAKYKSIVQKIQSTMRWLSVSKSDLIPPTIQRQKTNQVKMKEHKW